MATVTLYQYKIRKRDFPAKWYNSVPMSQNGAKIRTIIFDVGNVILHYDYLRAAKRLARETGLSLETVERNFFFSEWESLFCAGKIGAEEFYAKLAKDLALTMTFEAFSGIWSDIFWVNHSTEDLLKALTGKYRLASISNTNELFVRYWLRDFPVLKLIETFFFSNEVGLRKPDPAIFSLALEKLGAEPEETVFIDDLEENVQAADSVGMHGIRFTSAAEVRENLKELGVET